MMISLFDIHLGALCIVMKKQITKICKHCGDEFSRPPSLSRAVFCGKKCYDKYQRTSERRDIKCEACGDMFNTPQDHGAWPKFCSRKCFISVCVSAKIVDCAVCGKSFKADRSIHSGELKRCCSKKCAGIERRNGDDLPCDQCGKIIYARQHKQQSNKNNFCSPQCHALFNSGTNATGYKGGSYIGAATGHRYMNTKHGWFAEHRIIVGKLLDRDLRYWSEPIIHLNGVADDNSPTNLYVFPDMEQMIKTIHHGTMPVISNISPLTYKGV